jgi:hypothetical protein
MRLIASPEEIFHYSKTPIRQRHGLLYKHLILGTSLVTSFLQFTSTQLQSDILLSQRIRHTRITDKINLMSHKQVLHPRLELIHIMFPHIISILTDIPPFFLFIFLHGTKIHIFFISTLNFILFSCSYNLKCVVSEGLAGDEPSREIVNKTKCSCPTGARLFMFSSNLLMNFFLLLDI